MDALAFTLPFAILNSTDWVPESSALTNLARLTADKTNSQPQLAFALRRRPGKHNFKVANEKIKPENYRGKMKKTVASGAKVKSFDDRLRVIAAQNRLDAPKVNVSSTVDDAEILDER